MTNLVTYDLNDGVATITMDDGKANALSHPMFDELEAAFDTAEKENAIVLFKGRERRFSGGFDLKEMYKGTEQAVALTCRGSRFARRIMGFKSPVIGISTGHCIAMGAFTMLACDYRIGADGDFKIGLNETLIGMPLHNFGISLARYRLPNNYFNRSAINGEIFNPKGAVKAGFYDMVVPEEMIHAAAFKAGEQFKALKLNAFAYTKNKSREPIFAEMDAAIKMDEKPGTLPV